MKWYQHIYGEEDGRAKYLEKTNKKWAKNKEKIDATKEQRASYRTGKGKDKLKRVGYDIKNSFTDDWRGRRGTQNKETYDKVEKLLDEYFKSHFRIPGARTAERWRVQEFLGRFGDVPPVELLEFLDDIAARAHNAGSDY